MKLNPPHPGSNDSLPRRSSFPPSIRLPFQYGNLFLAEKDKQNKESLKDNFCKKVCISEGGPKYIRTKGTGQMKSLDFTKFTYLPFTVIVYSNSK